MAFTTYGNSAARSTSLRDRVETYLAALRTSWAQYKVYRQTVNELSGLSDRDLNDLGLSRAGIRGVALEAAYGAK